MKFLENKDDEKSLCFALATAFVLAEVHRASVHATSVDRVTVIDQSMDLAETLVHRAKKRYGRGRGIT